MLRASRSWRAMSRARATALRQPSSMATCKAGAWSERRRPLTPRARRWCRSAALAARRRPLTSCARCWPRTDRNCCCRGLEMTDQSIRRFSGRTALITGAAGAIGQAAAKRFADEGAGVARVARAAARVAQVADQLVAQGHAALPLGADVADEPAIAAAIARAEAHFGRIDVVFNNAGIGGYDMAVADMPTGQSGQG